MNETKGSYLMSDVNVPTVKLNDGVEMPTLGFGVFQVPDLSQAEQAVTDALNTGYRLIDTAAVYQNEKAVGKAIAKSSVKRDDIFVTSKLWVSDFNYDQAKKGIDASLQKLGLDYIDLYLLHQPYGKVDEAWRALEEAQKAGQIRSIGVSNMTPKLWKKWVPNFNVTPAVNQVEFSPYFQQQELRDILADSHVALEAWAPLGEGNKDLFAEPVLNDLAKKYNKDVGQIILRYEHQLGVIVFPKSVHEARIKSNAEIFDFELTSDEMDALRKLDKGKGMHDPDAPGVGEMLLNAFDVHAND